MQTWFGGAVTLAWSENLATREKSAITNRIMLNQQLAKELHKLITRKFEQPKVYSSFKDDIWGAGLVDMQLTSKYNKRFRFLLSVIDIFSKYD